MGSHLRKLMWKTYLRLASRTKHSIWQWEQIRNNTPNTTPKRRWGEKLPTNNVIIAGSWDVISGASHWSEAKISNGIGGWIIRGNKPVPRTAEYRAKKSTTCGACTNSKHTGLKWNTLMSFELTRCEIISTWMIWHGLDWHETHRSDTVWTNIYDIRYFVFTWYEVIWIEMAKFSPGSLHSGITQRYNILSHRIPRVATDMQVLHSP